MLKFGILTILFCSTLIKVSVAQTTVDYFAACGQAPEFPIVTPYIVGGLPMKPGAIPWLINIRRGTELICGGAVIAPNLILTAAHCVVSTRRAYELAAWVNSYNISDLRDPNAQRVPFERFYVHPNYVLNSNSFDIAILKTRTRMTVNPVCLPCLGNNTMPFEPRVNEQCVVAGWGDIDKSFKSVLPQYAKVLVKDRDGYCAHEKMWQDSIDGTMMCTGSPGDSSPCRGDSGGPLMCNLEGQDNRWFASGVISWGPARCGSKSAVYASVVMLRKWVSHVLKKNGYIDSCKDEHMYPPPCEFPTPSLDSGVCKVAKVQQRCDATLYKTLENQYPVKAHFLLFNSTHKDVFTGQKCIERCCETVACKSAAYFRDTYECYLYADSICESRMNFQDRHASYFVKDC